MGQKTHPVGLRLGIVKTWDSRWFAGRDYADLLEEDLTIRKYLDRRLSQAGVSRVVIERKAKKGDIVFLSESGGGSALMALPAPGITLEDLKMVNRVLYFGCGCSMPEANAVRNQLALLRIKHARHVGDATMLHIATPEVPPKLRVHLHASYVDSTGYEKAKQGLNHY